jgi:hypothetical protein
MRRDTITHEFVELIPDVLGEGTVYVSPKYGTAAHLCCCGCGTEVTTPLAPAEWHLTFDGKTISLEPSIGRWGSPCQSHYWIREDRVVWGRQMSRAAIDTGRARVSARKAAYYGDEAAAADSQMPSQDVAPSGGGLWSRLRRRFSR